jgi:4-hydroxybenzoate polyprenyltransferase
MVGIQAAIGAVNDLADAGRDAGAKPGKPLPRGLVSGNAARALAAFGLALGLALSIPSGPTATGVAAVGLVIGLLYDLRLKGTAMSWLPFALGIPLVPIFAWLGAVGSVPQSFAILVPVGIAAGAALAIANAVADADRDRQAGVSSVAIALGRGAAWLLHAWLHLAVFAVALSSLVLGGGRGPVDFRLGFLAIGAGGCLVVLGAWLTRSRMADRRERGWELEAIGIGLAAIGWIGSVGTGS